MKQVAPDGHACPFSRLNDPQSVHTPYFSDDHVLYLTIIVGDQNFKLQRHKNFSWTSMITLAMKSVALSGHAELFSRQKSHEGRIFPFCHWSCSIAHNICWWYEIPTSKNVEVSRGRPLRPWWCSLFSLITMPALLPYKMSPQACIPPVLPMIMCYRSPSLFVTWISNFKNTSSLTTLVNLFVFHANTFSTSNEPRSVHTRFFADDHVQ